MPETEPFVVLITLSNVTEADSLDKKINKPLLLRLIPFFKAFIDTKQTHPQFRNMLDVMNGDV
jgi:hypothetical protein